MSVHLAIELAIGCCCQNLLQNVLLALSHIANQGDFGLNVASDLIEFTMIQRGLMG